MRHMLYPDEYMDSTYAIDFKKLYKDGYRGILFDIDNTLVPHGAPADERAIALFKELKQIGFTTCLISNNKEPRVKSFCDKVDSDYIFKAGKPLPGGYEEGIRKMKTTKENTLFIGVSDFYRRIRGKESRSLHDYGSPIHPKEEIQIVLKRYLERIVLFFYFRSIRKKSVEK